MLDQKRTSFLIPKSLPIGEKSRKDERPSFSKFGETPLAHNCIFSWFIAQSLENTSASQHANSPGIGMSFDAANSSMMLTGISTRLLYR